LHPCHGRLKDDVVQALALVGGQVDRHGR
jgi:hypothetical protein